MRGSSRNAYKTAVKMYQEFETRTSYKYLEEVIRNLREPICILGGWAVFFHVNKNFQKAPGRPYLGSRDIDLGFHIKEDIIKEELEHCTLAQTIKMSKTTGQIDRWHV